MRTRLVIWIIACLALSLSFGELWARLPAWLSPEGLQRYGVFHWGVLGLCVLWLWLKRRNVVSRMSAGGLGIPFALAGLALLALSIFVPRQDAFLIFMMLVGWLGIFGIHQQPYHGHWFAKNCEKLDGNFRNPGHLNGPGWPLPSQPAPRLP